MCINYHIDMSLQHTNRISKISVNVFFCFHITSLAHKDCNRLLSWKPECGSRPYGEPHLLELPALHPSWMQFPINKDEAH